MPKTIILTPQAPPPIGPYSQAVAVQGALVFTAGQIPLKPATNDMVAGDIKAQTRQVLENLKAVLESAGSNLSKVVKVTVFLADITDFALFNEVYGTYFPSEQPARSAFQVAALPLGARLEVEMVALV